MNFSLVHDLELDGFVGRACWDQWKQAMETITFLLVRGVTSRCLRGAGLKRKEQVDIGNTP